MLRAHDPFRRAQLAIATLFFFLGFQYATWVSRLPALKTELDLTEAQLGLLLMAGGVGAAASYPLVAVAMKRLGSRRLSLLAALALAVILPVLAVTPNYPVTLVVICLDGVAVGFLNVAMNAQGAALEVEYQRTAMARFHATFSAGSLAAALVASGVNLFTSALTVHFGVAALLLVLVVGLTRSGLLTSDQPTTQETAAQDAAEQPEPEPAAKRGLTLPTRVTIWMGLAMVFGTITEGAMNDWSTLYMKDVVSASAQVAPLGIAVVSGMMVLARIFADGWRARWGDGRIVVAGSALAGAGLATALLVGGVVPALIGFACVGLGTAAITPCVYVAAARQGSDALALVAAMGTIGLLAGPAIIGFIADGSSLVWGMSAVAASAGLVSLCSTRIRWKALAEV
ncbi:MULTISPECIES: MFS transporter [unclassified Kitasatospora]|uniref:MFS transporter n=1 Tax=unclassified Kitasatospora TaxID=2633591 RepID=UPI00070F8AF2|nr:MULTISPECIES: MFS transporter [unclassified Kitasatospora]KQV05479.1 transporter [Kitasatospora sp. Root107]KRB62285.1 transporter [Kitasatospora sp. Root187]